MKLLVVGIALSSLCFLAFGSLDSLSKQETTTNNKHLIEAENDLLLKKWSLSHYEVFKMDFDPEEIEKEGYIHFLKNNTYTSISEGKFEKGNYILNDEKIILTNSIEKGELKLIIKKLTENKLEVGIDDPTDSDAKYVTIHFINQ